MLYFFFEAKPLNHYVCVPTKLLTSIKEVPGWICWRRRVSKLRCLWFSPVTPSKRLDITLSGRHRFLSNVFIIYQLPIKPIPVAARSKAWVCGRSIAGAVVSNPTGGMDNCFERCVLSGRGLCDGAEGPYQMCVCVSLSVIKCNNNPLHLQWVSWMR
jgi:hypothetical protein